MNKLQEKFDRKTKELINHVQIHQKLSKKYINFLHKEKIIIGNIFLLIYIFIF